MSIILFILVLALFIFFHELGHFSVAKFFGIRVDEFAIGFPPRLFKFRRGETLYTLNLIPFGGFVKIYGENPTEEVLKSDEYKRSFIGKPKVVQALTLVAGVVFNVLFAWVLFSTALVLGLPTFETDQKYQDYVRTETVITTVLENSPAEEIGVLPGDKVLSISTGKISIAKPKAEEIADFIKNQSGPLFQIEFERDGVARAIDVEARSGLVENQKIIGISSSDVSILKLPLHLAIFEGIILTGEVTFEVTKGILGFIKEAFLGNASLNDVTGPVGIVGLVGDVSQFGASYFLSFAAFISINLAVINLLPFPALDGGRLFVVAIESITRRTINYKYLNAMNAFGFFLLIILMVLVTIQDVGKLLG